jgi:MoaA/NifB/PqqE/SkfB family radical SAM enzyme
MLTTNGVGLTQERLETLSRYPVRVLFSMDGDANAHKRFRQAYLLDDATAYERITETLERLRSGPVPWFVNCVLPPAAAGEVVDRYRWALDQGVPALQLNYAVGMRWPQAAREAFIAGVLETLRDDHNHPGRIQIYNWRSACEPVMLSDDLIVDVDGTVLHDGAIFLERAFGDLKRTYRRGHLDDLTAFDPLRWDLATIFEVMTGTWPEGSHEWEVVMDNCRLGAALNLAIDRLTEELGR